MSPPIPRSHLSRSYAETLRRVRILAEAACLSVADLPMPALPVSDYPALPGAGTWSGNAAAAIADQLCYARVSVRGHKVRRCRRQPPRRVVELAARRGL